MLVSWEEWKTQVPRKKPLRAKERTNNKLKPRMALTSGFEDGRHWWEAALHHPAPPSLPLHFAYMFENRKKYISIAQTWESFRKYPSVGKVKLSLLSITTVCWKKCKQMIGSILFLVNCKVGCLLFSTGSWNSGTTLHGGGREGKALFSFFYAGKASETGPLGQSVSTNFVADCRQPRHMIVKIKVVWKNPAPVTLLEEFQVITLSELFSEWPACSRTAKEAFLDNSVTSRHIPSHEKECCPMTEGSWNISKKNIIWVPLGFLLFLQHSSNQQQHWNHSKVNSLGPLDPHTCNTFYKRTFEGKGTQVVKMLYTSF